MPPPPTGRGTPGRRGRPGCAAGRRSVRRCSCRLQIRLPEVEMHVARLGAGSPQLLRVEGDVVQVVGDAALAGRRGVGIDMRPVVPHDGRSAEDTSELPSLMRTSYAVFF